MSKQHLATLDMIRIAPSVPGNLECRLHLGSYRADGSRIEDNIRNFDPRAIQKSRYGFVLTANTDINDMLKKQIIPAGYTLGDMTMIEHIAQREWNEDVLASRRARLNVNEIRFARVVKAVAFNMPDHPPQLGVQIGKIIYRPSGIELVDKEYALLNAMANTDEFFDRVDQLGEKDDFGSFNFDDKALLTHVATKVFQ